MKKIIIASCMLATSMASMAQIDSDDNQMFNHFGAGVELGTDGIGFNVATTASPYVQLRAGMSFMPGIKVSGIDVDMHMNEETKVRWNRFQEDNRYSAYHLPGKKLTEEVSVTGELNKTDFKFLVDLYPTKTSAWRLTVGFYAGTSKLVEAYTTDKQDHLDAVCKFNELAESSDVMYAGKKIGAQVGDYLLTPYAEGQPARGYVKVNGFRPYIGIGSGRAISNKHRFSFAWDLGCQFWGSPKFFAKQAKGDQQVGKEDVDGKGGGIIEAVSKISVYPTLNFRFNGRIL